MGASLTEIAQTLKDAKHKTKAKGASESDVKVQLIYAFNGTGKTRLSREFKSLLPTKLDGDTELELSEVVSKNYLYYNAFTEDLFYWDNDLENDTEPKLKIHPNTFTNWILERQGQDRNIISNFQHYTDEKLTPHFNEEYSVKNKNGNNITVGAFTEITFSYERGNDEISDNIKISKGEESNFVWCVFYSLLEQVIDVLNVAEPSDRETDQFDQLEYVFIDDPVSSLDDNRLIELAVNLAKLIKTSQSDLKFIITTHNPLFYNVLHNEFKKDKFKKYFLKKKGDGEHELVPHRNDSPFSYHLFLKTEIETAIETDQLKKYHFNYLRNILEKTSTFLGYDNWGELLAEITEGNPEPYITRIVNISSHSKHSGDEIAELSDDDKRVLNYLLKGLKEKYHFR
ncbi:AAA family ATPase [Listeria monocytogenes]|uniref:AAA family ATPase n=1 Tax=Listeria monocytogenes TaxID=1639 RepID=A0A5Y9DJD1_LISMN|nr:AAA family ATPase [Listeria monocytogenes]EAD2624999.1 anticodon nuclease [Listeria monocytogenes]EAF5219814.1 anticodon nuclease [Listeria monocytogenes]EBF5145945.1 anticodon nuclease [Listeria monocytogenes]ECQ6721966.1 AAA family ATPase [Listeria monocytogenes]EDP7542952.1 AAA family ATPase [Listeria monocytogenes]